ncbi:MULTISPECIES: hypothetical protein [unclassified Microcoleus]|uniref:hypothetical protein n=1 Tax=unclassified Microcoleus TaxID=2642155 RepID=UPI002FCF7F3B
MKRPRSPLKAIELVELLRPDEAMELLIEIAFLVSRPIVLGVRSLFGLGDRQVVLY